MAGTAAGSPDGSSLTASVEEGTTSRSSACCLQMASLPSRPATSPMLPSTSITPVTATLELQVRPLAMQTRLSATGTVSDLMKGGGQPHTQGVRTFSHRLARPTHSASQGLFNGLPPANPMPWW